MTDDEDYILDTCPKCWHSYDKIDIDFSICSRCGWSAAEGCYVKPARKKSKTRRESRTSRAQRAILKNLFSGGHMAKYGTRYRVWDRRKNPLNRFSVSTFLKIKRLCRERDGAFVIDLKKVRALRSNTWAKRYYLSLKK